MKSNYEKMIAEQRGWRHGASSWSMQLPCEELAEFYESGYALGQNHMRGINVEIARKHGIELQYIKTF